MSNGKQIQASPEPLAYVGPTIPGVATRNTVFNNGIPESLQEASDKEPAFKSLVIPISRLTQATRDINNQSGTTFAFFEKALAYQP